MLKQESLCCLCKTPFTSLSQPRMMPHCQHSSCTYCLKHLLTSKLNKITCQLCGQQYRLQEVDLQYFPKNIILNKALKEQSLTLLGLKKEETVETEESSGSSQLEQNFCYAHKKELEIICLTDRARICPHCALFGTHREHHLKTVKEVTQSIQQKDEQFQVCRSRKALLDCKMTSPEFRQSLIAQIAEHKNRLISDIKKKFAKLLQNLKLAEKNAYDDVAKRFKTVNRKISELLKKENEYNREYIFWQRRCQQIFQLARRCKNIQDKAHYYLNEPLDIFRDGDALLNDIQGKLNKNMETINTMISRIKVVENPNISNSLFNYINVVLEDQEQLQALGHIGHETISPRNVKTEGSEELIVFSSEQDIESSNLTPKNKRFSSSKETSNSRMSEKSIKRVVSSEIKLQTMSVEEVIAQFCQKQHDTLDLSNQSLCDYEINELLKFVKTFKKIKGLKLVKNRLTTDGLARIIDHLPSITNLNLSFNQLADDAIQLLLSNRTKVPQLRIVNLSNNRINERRSKIAIQQLKKQGLIVTI